MATCKVVTGINNVCGDLLQASGVDKDFWAGYVSDLSARFPLTQTGTITTFGFIPYNGLVKFEGRKWSHKFDSELSVAPGGSISYIHKGMVKLMNLSTADDVELQRMTQAQDMFIIWQDNNESFFISAPSKGFSAVAGPLKTSGQAENEDTLATVNLIASEKVMPLRFSAGTTAATILYLDSLIR